VKAIGGSSLRGGKSFFLIVRKSEILSPVSTASDRMTRSLRFATSNIFLTWSIVKGKFLVVWTVCETLLPERIMAGIW